MRGKVVRSKMQDKTFWENINDVNLSNEFDTKREVVVINTNQKFQKLIGFGGAFTEAASSTFYTLDEDKQKEVLAAYFDKENGLGYNLGRVHIHSCDFAFGNYTYIEDGDKNLDTFDISHEDKWVVPLIKSAMEVAKENIQLLASPWSPPAFMKDTKEMNYGGKLLDEYKQSWANYYVKFIEHMAKRDIDIWGVSVQNEPQAVQTWDSCVYSSEDERDFVKNNLGPAMHEAGYSDKAIIIWDHNRDIMVERALTILSDEEANKYIWGVGNHWYVSEDFNNLSIVKNMYPDKHLIFTEGCVEFGIYGDASRWENGEMYGRNIIGDFNNYCEGFIDWNLYLNEIGGPNHVGNYCEAPIMIDTKNGGVKYNPSYYYIGHFSKYIKKDAVRVSSCISEKLKSEKLHVVSFVNIDESIVVVIQNEGWIKELTLMIDGKGCNITVPNRSITTYVFR